jgi:type VI secretion system secreted protein Hcp
LQAYLNIEKIAKGQVTEKEHKNWIYIQSFGYGVSQESTGDPSQQGKLVAGAVHYSEITVTKDADTTSPEIGKFCSSGKTVGLVKIHVCDDSNKAEPVMAIELSDCLISSYSVSAGGGVRPSESLSLRYSKIKVMCTAINEKGDKGATTEYAWSLLEKALA